MRCYLCGGLPDFSIGFTSDYGESGGLQMGALTPSNPCGFATACITVAACRQIDNMPDIPRFYD